MLIDNPDAKLLAGGTDLLVNMKHRVETPNFLVSIKGISGLDFTEQKNGALRIGALTSLKRIHRNPLVNERLPGLSQAASSVGSYHHQTMGTLGGNICQQNRCRYFNQSTWWRSARPLCFKAGGETCYVLSKESVCYSSYCGDVAPILIALDGRAILESAKTRREISVEDLFSGDGKDPLNLKAGEILTEVVIPEEATDGVSTYAKFANRDSIDFPIAGMGLWVSLKKKEVRVSFTAVDRRPVRAKGVEKFLSGKDLTPETLEEAVKIAVKEATPVKTAVTSPAHKRALMGLLLKGELIDVARGGRS